MDKGKAGSGGKKADAKQTGGKTAGNPPPGMKVGGGKQATPVGSKVSGKG